MTGLVALIRIMRPSEKRLLQHHLNRNTNTEEKLRLKLFKLIDKGIDTDKEAVAKLYGGNATSSYSHLKSRLTNDILNVLLLQDASKRIAQPNRAAELDCRKKVAQSHLLLLRGAEIEGKKVLSSALKTADKYELIAEKLQINHLLREKFQGVGQSKELNELNKKIAKDLKKYEALLNVEERSFLFTSPEFAARIKNRSNNKENLELIEDLQRLYKKHKLSRIGFWYYMVATEFHSARDNHYDVVKLGLRFLKLVETSPAIRSKTNIAGVNLTVGASNLKLREFDKARAHFNKATSLFASTGFNRLQGLELLARAGLGLKAFDEVKTQVGLALQHPRIDRREGLRSKWLFIKASVEFMDGDVDASFKTLNSNGELTKRPDEWNVQYRLLEMMQMVEMKDEVWLEFKIDTTKKFFNRHKELVNPRVKLAIDILSNLSRKDLEFDGLSEKVLTDLKLSLNEHKGFEWDPMGAELVRIDSWVASKIPGFQNDEPVP